MESDTEDTLTATYVCRLEEKKKQIKTFETWRPQPGFKQNDIIIIITVMDTYVKESFPFPSLPTTCNSSRFVSHGRSVTLPVVTRCLPYFWVAEGNGRGKIKREQKT